MPQYLQFSVYFVNKAIVYSRSHINSCFRTERSFWVSLWHSTERFMFKTPAGLARIHLNVVSVFIKLWPAEQDTWTDSYLGCLCVECAHHVHVCLWMCVWLYGCALSVNLLPEWTGNQSEPQSLYDRSTDYTQTGGTFYRWVGNWGLSFILNRLLLSIYQNQIIFMTIHSNNASRTWCTVPLIQREQSTNSIVEQTNRIVPSFPLCKEICDSWVHKVFIYFLVKVHQLGIWSALFTYFNSHTIYTTKWNRIGMHLEFHSLGSAEPLLV